MSNDYEDENGAIDDGERELLEYLEDLKLNERNELTELFGRVKGIMRFASAIIVTEMTCPFCGALLLVHSDNNFRVHETLHQQPVCNRWVKFCSDSGAKFLGERVVEPTNSKLN